MSSKEFSEWIVYYSEYSFDVNKEWNDFRAGVVASTVANFAGKTSKKAMKPSDFIPTVKEKPKKQTGKDMEKIARLIASLYS